jgi:hypothetical protein
VYLTIYKKSMLSRLKKKFSYGESCTLLDAQTLNSDHPFHLKWRGSLSNFRWVVKYSGPWMVSNGITLLNFLRC